MRSRARQKQTWKTAGGELAAVVKLFPRVISTSGNDAFQKMLSYCVMQVDELQ
jgi:hypothetical protein